MLLLHKPSSQATAARYVKLPLQVNFMSLKWRCGLPWLSAQEAACQCRLETGDVGSIPGSRRSPGEGNGNLLQCSCLENLMDRGG